jgi:hypothetical protein
MGQSNKDFPLQEEGLAFPTITGTGQTECTALTAGNPPKFSASSVHQIWTNEEFFERLGSDWVSVQIPR